MTKKPIIPLAGGIGLLLGVTLLCWQKPTPAGMVHDGSSSSSKSVNKRTTSTVSTENLLERLATYAENNESFDRETFATLMAKLLQLDANAAARFAESLPAGQARDEALRRLARGLAARDPERAEQWASSLSDMTERSSALGDVCFQISQTDPGEAVRKYEHHHLDGTSSLQLDTLVQQWAGQDFSAAAAWTLARSAGQQREQLCTRLAIVQSATDPENAARLVLEQIPEGSNQTEALISVVNQWASRDRESASTWVALFPAGPLKERAENELSQPGSLR
ncbi:hypothetical protein [Luteolibacter soli]|uniref:HEAT repeat domain-containing protein n=1 Tax=Luteolibacter soli TaxID=3135280 RepID=A0ABU9AYF5_9BACT